MNKQEALREILSKLSETYIIRADAPTMKAACLDLQRVVDDCVNFIDKELKNVTN